MSDRPPPADAIASTPRRWLISSLSAVPWLMLFFQIDRIIPRHIKAVQQLGGQLPQITLWQLQIDQWLKRNPLLGLAIVGVILFGSILLALSIQSRSLSRGQKALWLFLLFAVPTVLLITSAIGVELGQSRLTPRSFR